MVIRSCGKRESCSGALGKLSLSRSKPCWLARDLRIVSCVIRSPAAILPLQVMKYCARLSTTPIFLSPSTMQLPGAPGGHDAAARFCTPIPGTRSSVSSGAVLTSTGNSSR